MGVFGCLRGALERGLYLQCTSGLWRRESGTGSAIESSDAATSPRSREPACGHACGHADHDCDWHLQHHASHDHDHHDHNPCGPGHPIRPRPVVDPDDPCSRAGQEAAHRVHGRETRDPRRQRRAPAKRQAAAAHQEAEARADQVISVISPC